MKYIKQSKDSYQLMMRQPAACFEEAYPIGNGSQGAMIYGGVEEEKLSSKDLEFANEIVEAFMDNKEDFSKELDEILEHYQRDRLFKVDLALLYLALAEMKCLKTPKAVVVNEVLEIAKKYSTEKSQKFINGVLAKTE